MKNYIKEDQKLPIYGVGPYLICAIAMTTLVGVCMSGSILKSGVLYGIWILIFRICGGFMIIGGIVIWYIGALKSEMDENIIENRLKTDGIYSWVRNPMYTGWWMLISGISLMWHNVWFIGFAVFNWAIMSLVVVNTEEKWLLDLYGDEYIAYKKQVNRFIPWISHINK